MMTTTRQIITTENELLHNLLYASCSVDCWVTFPGNDIIPPQDYKVVDYRKADSYYEYEFVGPFGRMWAAFNTPGVQWYCLERYYNCTGLLKKDKLMAQFLKPVEATTRPTHIEMEAVKSAALECLHALYQNLDEDKALCLCSTTDRLFKVTVERKG